MSKIEYLSLSTVKLELCCNRVLLGPATGFLWQYNSSNYLVSNWHVFSGMNNETGEVIHSSKYTPDSVILRVPVGPVESQQSQKIELALTDEAGNRTWLQHPDYGRTADIGVVCLSDLKGKQVFPLNRAPNMFEDLFVRAGDEVTILGFPKGLDRQLGFPLWKRGSIASEPEILYDDLPLFVVDSATRNGMSGSPVIARQRGSREHKDESHELAQGVSYRFMGVYSGRYSSKDELDAQLGRVWHSYLVDETIIGQKVANTNISGAPAATNGDDSAL